MPPPFCNMTLRGASLVLAASLSIGTVQAGTFNVPYESPVFTIEVPDRWNPNDSPDGVDGASPDRSMVFFVSIAAVDDCEGSRRGAPHFGKSRPEDRPHEIDGG